MLCYYCCPGKIKSTSTYSLIIRLPWQKQLWGLLRFAQAQAETSKVPKGREITDGGFNPPVIAQQHEKSRRDDRDRSNLILNRLCTLSPFQGLVLLMRLFRGLTPPSVVYRAFGAFPRTVILCYSFSETGSFLIRRFGADFDLSGSSFSLLFATWHYPFSEQAKSFTKEFWIIPTYLHFTI